MPLTVRVKSESCVIRWCLLQASGVWSIMRWESDKQSCDRCTHACDKNAPEMFRERRGEWNHPKYWINATFSFAVNTGRCESARRYSVLQRISSGNTVNNPSIQLIFTKSIGPLIPFDRLIDANSRTSTDRSEFVCFRQENDAPNSHVHVRIAERRIKLLEHT